MATDPDDTETTPDSQEDQEKLTAEGAAMDAEEETPPNQDDVAAEWAAMAEEGESDGAAAVPLDELKTR